MAILFEGKESDPKDLEGVVFLGLGAASACWENLGGSGEFQSTRCKEIGDEIIAWIMDNYEPVAESREEIHARYERLKRG